MVFGRRYRVTEKIGTGGMAEVYKAVDEVLGRTVAVKVMHPRYASDPNYAARFRQEAQAAANLQSPYIVNIYDWGQEGDTYYIVMEYVRGTDLKTVIQQKGALDSKRVAELGAQVCSALSVAHGYDVIHRDIKPQNIMVTPDGSAKVMDFGIARAGNTTMTQTGSVLGTAHYVSPEQAQGRPLTPASDLYSLGIVLYEAATGHLPFDADSPVAVALKQVNESAPMPRALNGSIDLGLEAIIVSAMAKDPAARYDTADEMRRDLLRVVQGREVTPGAAAAPVAAMAPANTQATAVMPQVGGDSYDGGSGRSTSRSSVPRRRPVWPWIALAVLLIAGGLGIAGYMGLLGPQSAPVPEVIGLSQADAEAKIVEDGFLVGKVKQQSSKDVAEGNVIDQSPVAGAPAVPGSTVSLTVSTGPKQVDVPKIEGLPVAEAEQAIADAGLIPQRQPDAFDPKIAYGIVISQDPSPGTADEGSVVSFVVSSGPKMATVPGVVGKKRSTAEATLHKASFKVKVIPQFDETIAEGIVISQNPNKGFAGTEGSTVTIYVSKGPDRVSVPPVIGKTEADAIAAIQAAGLVVSKTYAIQTASGNVYEQSPSAGEKVLPGSTVNITIDGVAP